MKKAIKSKAARIAFIIGCFLLLAATLLALAEGPSDIRLPKQSDDKKQIFEKSGAVIQFQYASQGYILVKFKKTDKRVKLRLSVGKAMYTYDLNGEGEFEVFPLQMGDGKYKVQLFQEAGGGQYANVASKNLDVKLDDPNIPYLYPSQYVNYNAETNAVAKSFELCVDMKTEEEKIKAIYAYCSRNITYNYARARSVKSGYLPNIGSVLDEKTGICFDYSAVMACMLRVQGIPVQLVIGYADKQYHAWNHVLVGGKWFRYDATFAATGNQVQSYVEERHY